MKPMDLAQIRVMQALEWLARVRAGQLDPQAHDAWMKWLSTDARNATAYEEAEQSWELAGLAAERPAVSALIAQLDDVVREPAPQRRWMPQQGSRIAWVAGLAASVLVIAGVATLYLRNREVVSDFATAVGEQRAVALSDTSTVTLNTATQVRIHYSRAQRRVELLSGEAFFEVASNAQRPFTVEALRGVITAVGTQFDVLTDAAHVEVSVLEGTVSVRSPDAATGDARVSGGQAVEYTREGGLSAVRDVDANRVRAWRVQRLIFNDLPLTGALAEFNRYVTTPLVVAPGPLADRRVNGVFRIGEQEAFLNALEQALPLTVVREPRRVLLQPR
jgi:transmembrane sensor